MTLLFDERAVTPTKALALYPAANRRRGRETLQQTDAGSSAGPSKLGSWLVLIVGCVAFVVAKHITSRGQVTLDQAEIWLLGILPIACTMLLRRVVGERSPPTRSVFLTGWLFSLLLFVLLRASFISESFEFPLYEALNYREHLSYAALAAIYSAFGYGLAIMLQLLWKQRFAAHRLGALAVGYLLNWALFFALVFTLAN